MSYIEINTGEWLYRLQIANAYYENKEKTIKKIWDDDPEVSVPIFYNKHRKKNLRSLGWEHTSLCDYETLLSYGLINEDDCEKLSYWEQRYINILRILCAVESGCAVHLSLSDFHLLNQFVEHFGGKK